MTQEQHEINQELTILFQNFGANQCPENADAIGEFGKQHPEYRKLLSKFAMIMAYESALVSRQHNKNVGQAIAAPTKEETNERIWTEVADQKLDPDTVSAIVAQLIKQFAAQQEKSRETNYKNN